MWWMRVAPIVCAHFGHNMNSLAFSLAFTRSFLPYTCKSEEENYSLLYIWHVQVLARNKRLYQKLVSLLTYTTVYAFTFALFFCLSPIHSHSLRVCVREPKRTKSQTTEWERARHLLRCATTRPVYFYYQTRGSARSLSRFSSLLGRSLSEIHADFFDNNANWKCGF